MRTKLFLFILLVVCNSIFSAEKIHFSSLPKTIFAEEISKSNKVKGGLSEINSTLIANKTDLELPDKKLLRGFERFPKTDAFGDLLSDEFLYYRQLLSEEKKSAYDEIYKALMNHSNSLDIVTRITNGDLNKVIEAVYYDNPEIYWWSADCSWYFNPNNGYVTKIIFNYLFSNDQMQGIAETFTSLSLPIIFYANLLDGEMDKIKYIHDYLCLSIEYDYESFYSGNYGGKLQTAYSAIVEYKTVCAGYSRAFAYYLQQLGIPCTILWGSGHAWNFLKIGNDYYQMYVTWDDGNKVPPFFNLSHAQMQQVEMHSPSEFSSMIISNYPTKSNSMNYNTYFGNIPIGHPYTYAEFRNIEEDINNPIYAKIYTER